VSSGRNLGELPIIDSRRAASPLTFEDGPGGKRLHEAPESD